MNKFPEFKKFTLLGSSEVIAGCDTNVTQISTHTIKKFKKPEKLSKKLSKKDKGGCWFFYIYGGFNKTQTFEQHIKWLVTFGHFYYAFKNDKLYNSYWENK